MIVKNFYNPKVIRFDVNPIISSLSIDDTNQESELFALIGGTETEPNIIVMSYKLHVTIKKDKKEVLGYRLEHGFAFITETKEKDIKSIEELFMVFYNSVKKHIEENTTLGLSDRDDYDIIAFKVISSLEEKGNYL